MTDTDRKNLLDLLPADHRPKAEKKIMWAESMGWTGIHLSDGDGHPHHRDLAGYRPSGTWDFLSELESDV